MNVGTTIDEYEIFWTVVTVIAPGGRLTTTCKAHRIIASANKSGVACKAAGRNNTNGFALMVNNNSMVDTFIVCLLRRYHRYCTKAIASPPFKLYPKMLARMLEIVVTYD